MSAEKRQWTDAERISAAEKIYDMCSGDWGEMSMDSAIELQCEHTALYEALAGMLDEHVNCPPHLRLMKGHVESCKKCKARAALSAAQKGTR